MHYHVNVTSTEIECLCAIKVEIKSNKEFYSKNYGVDLDELCSNSSIYETESDPIDVILQAAASCFACKVVLLYTIGEQIVFREVKGRGNIVESPIYIHQVDKVRLQFQSLLFKKESVQHYKKKTTLSRNYL